MALYKTVLVTGASAGFGFAICEKLASQGYKVIATARRQDKLDSLANKYKGQISDSQWEYLAKSSTSTKFNDLCTELKIPSSINREQLKADAAEYYKYVQFKRKKFKHIGTEFSNDGRVSKMSFEETN